jgi:Myb-like DNA-binding domain
MTGAQQRGTNWTPEDDRRLLDLIEAGKSWVFISANLRRPAKTIRNRLAYLRRQPKKADLDSTVEARAEGEGRETVVTQKARWSYAEDRRFMQLATSLKSVEAVAAEMQRTPKNVAQAAKRLGVSLKSDSRRKAKKK